MPAELPGSMPSQEEAYSPLNLRGSSGYFPSLPTIPGKNFEYHELPGSMLSTQKEVEPHLRLPSSQDAHAPSILLPAVSMLPQKKPYHPTVKRKPLYKHTSLPTSLPSFPRQPSLESELAQYLLPQSEVSNEDTTSPSSDTSTSSFGRPLSATSEEPTSSNTTSSPHDTRPVKLLSSGAVTDTAQPLSTQEKRRRAHTRRLEAAFGRD